MEEYVKTKEIDTKLRWTVESLMRIVAPLKDGPSTAADNNDDDEDDADGGVLKQLDIITKRVKLGVEELTKYRKRKNNNTSTNEERDSDELLEKEVVENAKNVVDVKTNE